MRVLQYLLLLLCPLAITAQTTPLSNATGVDLYYLIKVTDGNTSTGSSTSFIDNYKSDLTRAMNMMASQVLGETTSAVARRRRDLRALTMVAIEGSTVITNLTSFPCSNITINASSTDLCQNVTHQISLIGANATNLTIYQANLYLAISEGRYEMELEAVNPSSPVTILNVSAFVKPPAKTLENVGLKTGGIIGIVFAVIMAVLLLMFVYRIGSQEVADPYK